MKEISLNILDITENSVKAGASLTSIIIDETDDTLTLKITDNGCGMDEDTLKAVTDPFFTTRTTRSVGMGVPLLKLEAEMTGGSFSITSSTDVIAHGTTVEALFYKNHIDYTPLGDVDESIITLIQGHPDTDFEYIHYLNGEIIKELRTTMLREQLGDEIPLNTYEVLCWIREFLKGEE